LIPDRDRVTIPESDEGQVTGLEIERPKGVHTVRLPVQVLVYVVRPAQRRQHYLVLRRVPGRGGFWQGITGGVEPGETIAQAAARELAEEVGLVPITLHRMDYCYSFPVEDRWRHAYAPDVQEIVEYVFLAGVDENAEPVLSWEHDAWRWCSFDEAAGLLTWPENVEALRRCEAFAENQLGRSLRPRQLSASCHDGVASYSDEEEDP
jgi:dATP pyrophosphohydrolase